MLKKYTFLPTKSPKFLEIDVDICDMWAGYILLFLYFTYCCLSRCAWLVWHKLWCIYNKLSHTSWDVWISCFLGRVLFSWTTLSTNDVHLVSTFMLMMIEANHQGYHDYKTLSRVVNSFINEAHESIYISQNVCVSHGWYKSLMQYSIYCIYLIPRCPSFPCSSTWFLTVAHRLEVSW